MSGTKTGGIKAAKTNKKRYGKGFYRKIGAMGGKSSRGGGFGSELRGKDGMTGYERARVAGAKGGKTSRKTNENY
ncbi:hypothetical protein [Polynucleobacter sp.]|uniref:hypothetical protein n=1 Tax=Polynucleobacter sp. TaxID=2029855 RepID=UPI003F69B9F5